MDRSNAKMKWSFSRDQGNERKALHIPVISRNGIMIIVLWSELLNRLRLKKGIPPFDQKRQLCREPS